MSTKTGIFLLFCFLQADAFEAGSNSTATYVSSRDYFSTLVTRIDSARSSIIAVVYLFSLYSGRSDAQTTKVANALANARKRGVAVRVILNRNDPLQPADESELNASNRAAYEYLKAHDINVCFGDVPGPLHAKAMIIDSSIVLLGSTNWSDAAFNKNTEANALIQSREFARAALAELGAIRAIVMQDNDTTAARVPVKFLTDTTLLSRMVFTCNDRLFDIYVYLLRLGYLHPADSMLALDYKPLVHYLGMDSLLPRDSRGGINSCLDALQNQYGLIKSTPHYGRDADIRLVPVPGDYVAVPSGYFKWGWNRELDFSGKVMEILSLYFSSMSPDRPKWSLGLRSLQKRFGFSQPFIYKGTEELRRKNLLIVENFPTPNDDYDNRQPSVYMPLPLYDPAALAATWKSLEAKYGKEQTDRARKYAGIVLKDCDADAVQELIELEKQFGRDRIEQAAKIIMAKNVENPERTLEYFIGIVRKRESVGKTGYLDTTAKPVTR
jgi:hypothetical protein